MKRRLKSGQAVFCRVSCSTICLEAIESAIESFYIISVGHRGDLRLILYYGASGAFFASDLLLPAESPFASIWCRSGSSYV